MAIWVISCSLLLFVCVACRSDCLCRVMKVQMRMCLLLLSECNLLLLTQVQVERRNKKSGLEKRAKGDEGRK